VLVAVTVRDGEPERVDVLVCVADRDGGQQPTSAYVDESKVRPALQYGCEVDGAKQVTGNEAGWTQSSAH